ncbi:MAG: fused MFS/spermidine synthase [Anaerolineae bacterium]|nr:fused MFS/spermidine synthase [Anaerolineae bacterium]
MTLYLYITAFVGGLVSLALEMTASRLLEPFFGTSNLVWSAIVGMILLFLSIGAAIGGRWADRSPKPATLYSLLVVAGVTIALIPFISRPVLLIAAQGFLSWNVGQVLGSFMATIILFAVPVTLLACISPFVTRLSLTDLELSGVISGRISSISTAGSFLGTFLPTLLLTPMLGTRRTFLILSAVTLLIALGGLWFAERRRFLYAAGLFPIIIGLFFLKPVTVKPQAGLIHERESAYNFIQVIEKTRKVRYLLLNEGQGIHSVYTPGQVLTGGTWDYFLIAPYFNPAPYSPDEIKSLLVIGLAAGTTPYQYTSVYGPVEIDGVEIDPAIVEVGQEYFGMTQPNLNVHIADGRYFLNQTEKKYDVVAVDAYRLPYIPWHLTTLEFFQQVQSHLTDNGVVAINVGHTENDWRLVDAMVATMRQVYPSVHTISVPGTFNAIVIATMQPSTPKNLEANYPLLRDQRLEAVTISAYNNIREPQPSHLIFTDDRAPVEQVTNDLVVRYVLGIQ